MLKPFPTLILAIITAAATASVFGSLGLQQPAQGDESSLPIHKVASRDVPDCLAWKEFVDSVQSHYEYGETSFFLCGKLVQKQEV